MAFYFKTQGREYSFTLESDGLLHANEINLKAETLKELQELVKAHVKAEKSLPRIPVIIMGNRWGYFKEATFGTASARADRHGYRWVSYQDGDGTETKQKTKRRTFDGDSLVLDTPTNREIVARMADLGDQITDLHQKQAQLRSQLTQIGEEAEAV